MSDLWVVAANSTSQMAYWYENIMSVSSIILTSGYMDPTAHFISFVYFLLWRMCGWGLWVLRSQPWYCRIFLIYMGQENLMNLLLYWTSISLNILRSPSSLRGCMKLSCILSKSTVVIPSKGAVTSKSSN